MDLSDSESVEKDNKNDIKHLHKENNKEIKNVITALGVTIDPDKITKKNMEVTYFSGNLSTTVDTKLQALNDAELELFMQEMQVYLQLNNDIGEMKEETIKIFAAWRLYASYRERSYRVNQKQPEINQFLHTIKKAIQQYPYKMGFYDVYLLTLFNLIEQEDEGYVELKGFLKALPSYFESSEGESLSYQIYFSSVREKILNTIQSNWYRFDEEKRMAIRKILEQVFLKWYANPNIQWTEQYTLYWTLSILRIRLPIHFCISERKKYPSYLNLLDEIYKRYFFIYKNQAKTDKKKLYIGLYLFSKGLYWCNIKKKYKFYEVDSVIYNVIERDIHQETYIYNWLAFAKISGEELTKNHFYLLEKIKSDTNKNQKADQNADKNNSEIEYELFDFLQLNIKRYFEQPEKSQAIFKWAKSGGKTPASKYKKYVRERFDSYAAIRSYYSLTDIKLPKLPLLKEEKSEEIPIADWIFYCEMMPYHLETIESKQNVLHPLTEYEHVKLLGEIMKKKQSINNDEILFSIKLSFEEWEDIREDNKTSSKKPSDPKDTKGLVKTLFAMLTNRPSHTHIRKVFSMYKWNDLQSYFEMTYYPSSEVANLFVNNLNIHQEFYQKVYNMPLEDLPYRDVFSKEGKEKNIEEWVEQYIEKCKDKLIKKKYNRQLELLEIDIDQLRG